MSKRQGGPMGGGPHGGMGAGEKDEISFRI